MGKLPIRDLTPDRNVTCPSGDAIPIEEREGDELRVVHGCGNDGRPAAVRQLPADEAVANPAFDVTPARFVAAVITERGSAAANALPTLYPEEDHG